MSIFASEELASMHIDVESEIRLDLPISRYWDVGTVSTAVAAAIKDLQPDLLHSHHFATDIFCVPSKDHASSRSIIRHVHGILQRSSTNPMPQKSVRFDWTTEEIAREWEIEPFVGRTICVSRELRDKLVHYAFPPEKIEVLPNAIDLSCFEPADPSSRRRARTFFNLKSDDYVVGFLGRIEPCKNLEFLLSLAWAQRALQKRPKYLVMGSGQLERELQSQVVAAELADAFSVHSASARVHEFYAAIDVLIVPSHTEGAPFVVLEAMASGVPILASAVGGITDTIRHGTEGFLFDIKDIESALAMLCHLECEDLRAQLARQARRRAAAEFSVTEHQTRLLNSYTQVLNGKSDA